MQCAQATTTTVALAAATPSSSSSAAAEAHCRPRGCSSAAASSSCTPGEQRRSFGSLRVAWPWPVDGRVGAPSRARSRAPQRTRSRPRSPAETEAESLEDVNLEEMDDEELDKLFDTYGEVVKEDPEPAPASSEVDDDAESLELAVALAEVANEVKAGEILVLCVKPLVYWTRFFVIATGFSRPQVDAIGKKMRDVAEERFKQKAVGDLKPNSWTLLDFGEVVAHIFYPDERAFYNLEEFYGNAITVDLPFESQSRVR